MSSDKWISFERLLSNTIFRFYAVNSNFAGFMCYLIPNANIITRVLLQRSRHYMANSSRGQGLLAVDARVKTVQAEAVRA